MTCKNWNSTGWDTLVSIKLFLGRKILRRDGFRCLSILISCLAGCWFICHIESYDHVRLRSVEAAGDTPQGVLFPPARGGRWGWIFTDGDELSVQACLTTLFIFLPLSFLFFYTVRLHCRPLSLRCASKSVRAFQGGRTRCKHHGCSLGLPRGLLRVRSPEPRRVSWGDSRLSAWSCSLKRKLRTAPCSACLERPRAAPWGSAPGRGAGRALELRRGGTRRQPGPADAAAKRWWRPGTWTSPRRTSGLRTASGPTAPSAWSSCAALAWCTGGYGRGYRGYSVVHRRVYGGRYRKFGTVRRGAAGPRWAGRGPCPSPPCPCGSSACSDRPAPAFPAPRDSRECPEFRLKQWRLNVLFFFFSPLPVSFLVGCW